MKIYSTSSHNAAGFTLIEIAVAVAILGVALVTLVGLQTRMLSAYQSDNYRAKAAFYAQYMMSMIELQQEPPQIGRNGGDLYTALDQTGYTADLDSTQIHKALKGWKYEQEVSSIDLPLLPDALRRVELRIYLGETTDDYYALIYVVPNEAPKTATVIQGAR